MPPTKRPASPADVAYERVRETCLRFPATEEKISHGSPWFHVRGKMFLAFVDNHHRDGRLAVWCKATPAQQRRLVASEPARFFVPPYVGVKGWVGVDVHPARADWIGLQLLVEEAWLSVAPPKVARGDVPAPAGPLPPAPRRVKTDEKVARAALDRLSAICLSLPEVERELDARHATFRVRKKVFAYFLDNHHGDGVVAACVKGDKRENARLVAREPGRFYAPAYVGSHGYLGVRLDAKRVDWKDLEERVEAAWRLAAPKTLAARRPG